MGFKGGQGTGRAGALGIDSGRAAKEGTIINLLHHNLSVQPPPNTHTYTHTHTHTHTHTKARSPYTKHQTASTPDVCELLLASDVDSDIGGPVGLPYDHALVHVIPGGHEEGAAGRQVIQGVQGGLGSGFRVQGLGLGFRVLGVGARRPSFGCCWGWIAG
jgi:hypothetical protein